MQQIRGVIVGAMVILGACTSLDDAEELELYETEQWELEHGGELIAPRGPAAGDGGGRTGGDWIINGLGDPSISGVNPDHALDSTDGLGTNGWLGQGDPDGEEAIRYMVECALNLGDSVMVDDGQVQYTFHGALGLAPEWETAACNQNCQQWVSACLLARTNPNEAQVSIFVQGDHSSLGYGFDPQYNLFEAVFFGNVFADPPVTHACQGTQAGLTAAAIRGRTCALLGTECDFTVHDSCSVDAGCAPGPTGVPTIDCQPDPAGPSYHGLSVHVDDPFGGPA